jgi:hypothetical protein
MTIDVDLSKKVLGIVTQNTPPVSIGESVPVFIPMIMCNVENGSEEPKTSYINTYGSTIFKNDSNCKPKASSTLKQQNYILAKKEDNTNLSRLLDKDDDIDGYVLPKGSKVEISFVHGKLSAVTFNTNYLFD